MSLKVAVQMDPLDRVDPKADSTFALMLEAQRRGYDLFVYQVGRLTIDIGGYPLADDVPQTKLWAQAQPVKLRRQTGNHARIGQLQRLDLAQTDVILMRQDPPFDMGYITSTHMLEHVHGRGAGKSLVVNDPVSVRNAPEKLLVTYYPDLMPPSLVSSDKEEMRAFHRHYGDVILKPLYGNGGAGIFRLLKDDENFSALYDLHFSRSNEPLMLQRYEPSVRRGDKRVLLVDGEPIGAINRVPAQGDARSNMHAGGRAEAASLTDRDREICARIGPYLKDNGLIFVGIDIIGEWLTEINVTSPTGLQELDFFDKINSAGFVWDAIEARL